MPDTPTPNLGLTVGTVGGDADAWGGTPGIDGNWAILDALGRVPSTPVSGNTTLSLTLPFTIIYATAGNAGIIITLPSPSVNVGRIVVIKRVDAAIGNMALASVSGTVEVNSLTNQGEAVWLHADGTNWKAIGAF